MGAAARESVKQLMRAMGAATCRCPAHSQAYGGSMGHATSAAPEEKEYAVEMACSNIRYGKGVTSEVAMDFQNMNAKKVCIMTDENMAKLPAMKMTLDSFHKHDVDYELYDTVRVEPTDGSFMKAIEFARKGNFDAFCAVGGGSVIDTCKAANLYSTDPEAELMDYVNAPLGKGKPVLHQVKPLIAVPTTAGTGSETTGVAVFDIESMKSKTGIASRAIRPLLGLVDPLHTLTMPNRVTAYSGFDVLCHAIESYTTIPYTERVPRPLNPKDRPAFQGSNPISDVWSKHALRVVAKYMKRAVNDQEDFEARSNLHLASAFAGIGFGNAGVHLCHGMSYPIAGSVKDYKCRDYNVEHPIIPHGLSVVLTAPAVFKFTYPMCPERHLEVAEIMGADIRNKKLDDAGLVLADTLRQFMYDLNVDNGLEAVGYTKDDIPHLVEGTLPQHRLIKLSPNPVDAESLTTLFEESMRLY